MNSIDCMAALRALADESRLRILRLLTKGDLTVNQVAEALAIPGYNASKHLRILKEAGLVACTKNGQHRIYALAPPLKQHLSINKNVLDLGCCLFRFDAFPG